MGRIVIHKMSIFSALLMPRTYWTVASGGVDYGLGDLDEITALACPGRDDVRVTCGREGVKGNFDSAISN